MTVATLKTAGSHTERALHKQLFGKDQPRKDQEWLDWQCGLTAGVEGAWLFRLKTDRHGIKGLQVPTQQVTASAAATLTACWPARTAFDQTLKAMLHRVRTCGRSEVTPLTTQDRSEHKDVYAIALPEKQPRHVLVIKARSRRDAERIALMQLVQWGAKWLTGPKHSEIASVETTPKAVSSQNFLSELIHTLSDPAVEYPFNKLVTLLSQAGACQRVSFATIQNDQVRLEAVSGLSQFDRRTRAARRVESVMREALRSRPGSRPESQAEDDQDPVITTACVTDSEPVNDPYSDTRVNLPTGSALQRLAADSNTRCLCVPLFKNHKNHGHPQTQDHGHPQTQDHGHPQIQGQDHGHPQFPIGVCLLQWRTEAQPSDAMVSQLIDLMSSVGQLISLQQQAGESLPQRISRRWTEISQLKLGFSLSRWQVTVLALTLAVIASALIPATYSVPATARIEGAHRQVIVAPHTGFIRDAAVQAGDLVQEGQALASLDNQELSLKRDKWASELAGLDRSYAQALAIQDRSEMIQINASRDAAVAEMRLLEQQLARSTMRSPVDGVVVSGDLDQKLGAPVNEGDPVYEIASMDSFRLMLEVPEAHIGQLQSNQVARVRLHAFPDRVMRARIEKPLPVAVVRDGRNVFRVFARLINAEADLRPGMQGIGRVETGQRSLLWSWTHTLVEKLQIWIWSIGL